MAAKKSPAKKSSARKPAKPVRKAAAKAPAKSAARSTAKAPQAKSKPATKATAPARKKPETLRLRAVAPSFTVNDLDKSLAFYRDVLGFIVSERWERDGKLLGVELLAGDVCFMLGQDDWKKGRDRVKGQGLRLYCGTVQDVDVLASEIKARGGTLDQEPTDQPYGMRDFSFTDPDGFKITIGKDTKKRP